MGGETLLTTNDKADPGEAAEAEREDAECSTMRTRGGWTLTSQGWFGRNTIVMRGQPATRSLGLLPMTHPRAGTVLSESSERASPTVPEMPDNTRG